MVGMFDQNHGIGSFQHLRQQPREKDALIMLKKIASAVKPIMRARNWKIGTLAEFLPKTPNLLGLNINRTHKIMLRLRYHNDPTLFLPYEEVVDTMLHELSHIVHGPHDGKFHALWDQLRDEWEALLRKGYSGEGFLGEGRRLGGSGQSNLNGWRRPGSGTGTGGGGQVPGGSGIRLGGSGPRPGQDIRTVIATAAEKRLRTLRGCGNEGHSEREIEEVTESATRNGFRTQAEEDDANEAAIAQALWELVQEEEKAKYGSSYIEASAEHPAGSQGDLGNRSNGSRTAGPCTSGSSNRPPPVPTATKPLMAATAPTAEWACNVCTLHNTADFLCCDACGTARSEEQTKQLQLQAKTAKRTRDAVDLTSSPPSRKPPKRTAISSAVAPPRPADWQCSYCGKLMEGRWWTCSNTACGRMKDKS